MRLVILDRDGVINQESEAFIKTPEEWIPLPDSLAAIARLYKNGYTVVVASNCASRVLLAVTVATGTTAARTELNAAIASCTEAAVC